jgi:hypothetical protein
LNKKLGCNNGDVYKYKKDKLEKNISSKCNNLDNKKLKTEDKFSSNKIQWNLNYKNTQQSRKSTNK